jgi:hypothetical protein
LALEQGRLTWRDTAKIATIRTRALEKGEKLTAQAAACQSGQQTPGNASNTQKQRYCASFNKGICTNTSKAHQSEHICAFCLNKKSKVRTHAEVDCHQKSGIFPQANNPSKND